MTVPQFQFEVMTIYHETRPDGFHRRYVATHVVWATDNQQAAALASDKIVAEYKSGDNPDGREISTFRTYRVKKLSPLESLGNQAE